MLSRNESIVKLWNEDKSSVEIGKLLGVTKNTVIGVVRRARDEGLITRKKLSGPKECGERGGKRAHQRHQAKMIGKIVSLPKIFAKPSIPDDEVIIGVPHEELSIGGCKYPTSTVDSTHYFCNEERRDHLSSYCAEHHSLCWRKIRKPSGDELARLLEGRKARQWMSTGGVRK